MISFETNNANQDCSRQARREFLRVGGLGALGLSLADWVRAESAGAVGGKRKAQSVILIYNCGAPSHIDLWDMKPQAPDEVRGQFKPVATNVPGIQISELMPSLTRHADKLSIIRSVHHEHGAHNSGMYWTIVGRPYPVDSTNINPNSTDYPSFGTLVGWLAQRENPNQLVPPYVITPVPTCDTFAFITPGQFGGMLGLRSDPLVLNGDPNATSFKVPNLDLSDGITIERMNARRSLLQLLDDRLPRLGDASVAAMDVAQERAFNVLASPKVRQAFDLTQEPAKLRDQYGRHTWGQSHLLARRLVEAGAKFVTTVNGQGIVWDSHINNFGRLKNDLVPPMQQSFAALLDDLSQRGLLDSTLVIWMGDFGRTPLINKDAGRDHWPQCYTVVMAGGGVPGGQYVGQSDRIGALPLVRPVSPADIHATVFSLLGYDPQRNFYRSPDGRPNPLSEGTPIAELL